MTQTVTRRRAVDRAGQNAEREDTPPKRGKRTNRPVPRPTSGGFCASRPSGRMRQRWTVTARTSSGCPRSTDSQQRGQPDSVRGCTNRNAAGWPRRWRRCATTMEPERRCPDRRRQRPDRGGLRLDVAGARRQSTTMLARTTGSCPVGWFAGGRSGRAGLPAMLQVRRPE